MSTAIERTASIQMTADSARRWLFEHAAPIWSTTGRQANGLFAERVFLNGQIDDAPYRVFVQARHIYAFAEIGYLGWSGSWAALITQTVELLLEKARRSDGFYVNSLTRNGDVCDARADLYVQAFVLFALARAGAALDRPDLFDEAERLADRLDAAWAHPQGGYYEGEIVDSSVRRQNPHMHLLEAFMALADASGRARFKDAAAQIAVLSRDNFISGETGALLEYFNHDWSPAPGIAGRIVEPGHCFEWAWLFERMAVAGWADGIKIADGLVSFARRVGIEANHGVAINELLLDETVHNENARLWPQTERLKAAVARYRRGDIAEANEIIAASEGLSKYLAVSIPGLWRDKLNSDGSWVEEPAPGSSLYHITCAYSELLFA